MPPLLTDLLIQLVLDRGLRIEIGLTFLEISLAFLEFSFSIVLKYTSSFTVGLTLI